ncbi:collagen-like protein [Fulvivirga lutimaris]|uniref:collagen-like protein n=1 Tax=Fulvivirga lutimaris TaxID=1819566 RepID=UPI0012BBF40E|nr:collagen-like protein [Fulvivirga lutimaris]MTI41590.1 collagen-like protein [Fulvivirga lutimaris]
MKILLTMISLGLLLTFGACSISNDGPIGPQGPQGPQGPTGPQGLDGEEAYVFEYEGVSFTGPDYEVVLPYADDFTALTSDVTLVYLLWGTDEVDGETVEVWRPLPQSIITANGLLQYNFDFTIYDVKLFLDAQFPLDNLTAQDTDNWVVRIVVVPGKFWNGRKGSTPSYDEVVELYNLPDLGGHENIIERKQ